MRCKREEEHPRCKQGRLRELLCVPWIEIHGYNIGRPYRTARKRLRLPVWLVFRHQPLFDAHLIILQTTKMLCKREEEHPRCKQGL